MLRGTDRTLEDNGQGSLFNQRGIAEVLRVLEQGSRSFVVYGEPQSGKTEFMIALVCKLLDMGRQTIFIVMNDNTELELQNFDRFHKAQELNPTPELASQIIAMSDSDLRTPTTGDFLQKELQQSEEAHS